jgi:hypothetical protein
MDLRNVGILPQHYTAPQPRRNSTWMTVQSGNQMKAHCWYENEFLKVKYCGIDSYQCARED